ncbi:hypothetical protein EV401DRAFT_340449 [Pisolithus croceorrhizus]|nr:hypothetical protein EV401DRAFT_340449 [Pisolithus croceorrhizus]
MNRIVQQNAQLLCGGSTDRTELESAVNSFLETRRQFWTRGAVCMLAVSQSAGKLAGLSLTMVTTMRDCEWKIRECSRCNTAIAEFNSLVYTGNERRTPFTFLISLILWMISLYLPLIKAMNFDNCHTSSAVETSKSYKLLIYSAFSGE